MHAGKREKNAAGPSREDAVDPWNITGPLPSFAEAKPPLPFQPPPPGVEVQAKFASWEPGSARSGPESVGPSTVPVPTAFTETCTVVAPSDLIGSGVLPFRPVWPAGTQQPEPSLSPTRADPALRPEDVPIQRFAAISAELAERRASRGEVLRTHGLDERSWAAVERHWRAAIEQEVARGRSRSRSLHDHAYVAAVEGFRGPIGLPEYARLAVGLERGRAGEVLDELAIQRPALMPIVRLWTKKIASDPKLTREAMALLEVLRATE